MYVDFSLTEEQVWCVIACLCMMFFDIVTGFLGAWRTRNIQSNKIRDGLFHKTALVLIIALAYLCEIFMLHIPSLEWNFPLIVGVCVIIIGMELSSIAENLTVLNPDLKDTKLLQKFQIGNSEKEVDSIGTTD